MQLDLLFSAFALRDYILIHNCSFCFTEVKNGVTSCAEEDKEDSKNAIIQSKDTFTSLSDMINLVSYLLINF